MRGQQYDHEMAVMERDYSGLQWGKLGPTDVDGFLDFGGEVFVFLEFKGSLGGMGKLSYGQELALTRLVDACSKAGVQSYLFLCHHDTPRGQAIVAHECTVTSRYDHGIWHTPRSTVSLKVAVSQVIPVRFKG